MTSLEQPTLAATSAAELYQQLIAGDPLFVLDVRNEEEFARMRIEGRDNALTTLNIPYFDFIEDEDAASARVPNDREILIVCAKQGSSEYVAEVLQARGYSVRYLSGGFIGWADFYDLRPVASGAWGSLIQIARPARGDLSFAVVSDGQAALIDPLRHVAVYEQLLAEQQAELRYILETHVHADHISGGPALAKQHRAPYFIHPYDAIHPIDMLPATFAYQPLGDGQRFELGQVTLETIWYPGHTLGQVNFLLHTPDGGRYLFSGDGIFITSFGRPDLGGQGEAWTPLLYTSMFERLPQHMTPSTLVLPAHFSSLDEDRAGDGVFAASYQDLLATNEALRPRSPEEFSAYVLSHLPAFPPEYVEIKRVNIGLREVCDGTAAELETGKNNCALSK